MNGAKQPGPRGFEQPLLDRFFCLTDNLSKQEYIEGAPKKRGGAHERSIRELRLEPGRITLGEPLREFRGILTGVPIFEGHSPSREGGGN